MSCSINSLKIVILIIVLPGISCSLLSSSTIVEDDVKCLEGVKNSLHDPQGKLNSWNFSNPTSGFLCNFDGVTCWNYQENRIINLKLIGLELSGQIPESLKYCKSLTLLDLSSNALSGTIPANICISLPYLVTLDLSYNNLSGSIPPDLVNCPYLNELLLSNNILSGPIPYEFSNLSRLNRFSVANNSLTGRIPSFFTNDFGSAPFVGNELCGRPLESRCRGLSKRNLVIVVAAGIVSLFLGIWVCCWWYSRRRKRGYGIGGGDDDASWAEKLTSPNTKLVQILRSMTEITDAVIANGGGQNNGQQLVMFSFKSILAATSNFSEANKLGEGGFGPVYKGKFPGDQQAAIKRLSRRSGQGVEEFMNELKLIANLQHKYLVRLLGCCVEREEKILVYEYMSNRSLDKFLYDPGEREKLFWDKRFKIIEGVAQGLLYIHKFSRLKVIHRDLKASNILLDEAMNPKISDFGMARIFDMNQTEANTNRVMGTYGYMSPEYAFSGQFSEKSDVFSFGVFLLEMVSGRRNTSFHRSGLSFTLLSWAWELLKEGKQVELIDVSIKDSCCIKEAVKCMHVGLLCVQEDPTDRPTMSLVVLMLSSDSLNFPSPKEPAFLTRRAADGSTQRTNECSNNELSLSLPEGR